MNLDLSPLSAPVLVVLGVLAIVEVALDVIALLDLARRPREAVVFGNKWAWIAIIVLVSFLGAVIYLAIGRKSVSPAEDTRTTPGPASSIAEELYGRPRDWPGAGESR
ncbi:MAG: PLD nuclease N-terminal domain-containing protein [Specibacter sp.]